MDLYCDTGSVVSICDNDVTGQLVPEYLVFVVVKWHLISDYGGMLEKSRKQGLGSRNC